MPTLAEMLALKSKPQTTTEDSNGKPDVPAQDSHVDSSASDTSSTSDAPVIGADANQSDELPRTDAVKPAAPMLKLGGIKLGGATASPKPSETGAVDGGKSASLGGIRLGTLKPPVASGAVAGESGHAEPSGNPTPAPTTGGLSLASLASLDTDAIPGVGGLAGTAELNGADDDADGYLDEVPATAPVRELPEHMSDLQMGFIKSLDSIYSLHDDPEMFTNMVRKIMSDMQEYPELAQLLATSKGADSNAMIRGLRQAAGMAQVKKIESKAKRGGAKTAGKSSAALDSALASLSGLAGLNLDDL